MRTGDSYSRYAERWGHRFGRGWRAYTQGERKAITWLVSRGFSSVTASVLLWSGKLVVWVLLLYISFWLALLLIFLILAACAARNLDENDEEEEQPQWRVGPAGYGLYRGDIRVDSGDPYDDDE
ncbi:DUF3742 family protein [Rahnella sp. CG8]|jgi:hypothetical protein|uniref:DUF3742 family protein n=1 Tax=Yersiniaceae TaxID=1903411 RepID=UPI001013CBF3|nr:MULTISPECIES: DUF3742 family protein [Yersiniaceae]MCM2446208.1 DUF3742 family protein [Rahnella sp. CG8]